MTPTAHRDHADPDLAERDLVARVRAGDAAAFEVVFRTHYEALCRFALAHGVGGEVAEDLVQDVFMRVWELGERLEVRDTVAAYLYGALRNRLLDYARHQAVHRRWQDRAAGTGVFALESARTPAADQRLEFDELDAAAARAVARLPDRCRQTFLLSRSHGLSYAEIAGVMDVSVKTVKIQMGRALKALRTALAPFCPPADD